MKIGTLLILSIGSLLVLAKLQGIGSAEAQQANISNSTNMTTGDIPTNIENKNGTVNLLDNKFIWKTINDANVFRSDGELNIVVDTTQRDKTYHRAYLQTQLNNTKPPVILSLNYSFNSLNSNVSIASEIRDNSSNILISNALSNNMTNAKFLLPDKILNKPIEVRLYVITEEPGLYVLSIKEAAIIGAA